MCLFCNDVCDVCSHHYTCKRCGAITDLEEGYCSTCREEIACDCGAIGEEYDGEYYCDDCYKDHFDKCVNCAGYGKIDDLHEYNGDYYCDDCFHETFTVCDDCGETIYFDDCVILEDEVLCEGCAEKFKCYECGEYTHDGVIIDYEYYCESCVFDNFIVCDDCGDHVPIDRYTEVDCRAICEGCLENYFFCDSCCTWFHYDDYGGDGYCYDCMEDVNGPGSPIIGTRFNRNKSKRCFGIEIETRDGDYACRPEGWGCKEDGSIIGMELVSPIMSGDEGIEAIEELYSKVGPEFDHRCGIHVHIDIRDLSKEERFSVIKAFRDNKAYWFSRVDPDRHHNTFCGDDYCDIRDDDVYDTYMNRIGGERYVWCNLQSIYKFGTIEIRLLEGTSDVDKVVEWVIDLLAFTDGVLV